MTCSRSHIIDDRALGGVTRALKNFEHPEIKVVGEQTIADLQSGDWKTTSSNGVGIIHFTANWQKLLELASLRRSKAFSSLILIEHSYTDGFERNCVTSQKRFRLMLKLAYRLVDNVVAVSDSQRNWMLAADLAPAEKIIAIPQARDCSHLFDVEIARRRPGPLRIGAFGRFHEQKGFDLLIDAMADIPPHAAELRIAGYGDQAELLTAKAADLPNVKIEPAFDCPKQFLADVEIVAIPSRWEAFGLVGAEARAAARPIIAANIDGLRDQIGTHSWSHTPNDVDSLRRAILDAAVATDLHERGSAARQHVSREYPKMIEAWAALQAELTSQTR